MYQPLPPPGPAKAAGKPFAWTAVALMALFVLVCSSSFSSPSALSTAIDETETFIRPGCATQRHRSFQPDGLHHLTRIRGGLIKWGKQPAPEPEEPKVEYAWPESPLVEPKSKTSFPPSSMGLGSSKGFLSGVAIRLKKILVSFKVYAVGLYIDPSAARESLSNFEGVSLEDLQKSPEFYKEMTKPDNFRKTLELKFLMGVSKSKVRDAFNEGLAVRMKKASGAEGEKLVNEVVDQFTDMKAGQSLIFHVEDGALSMKVHDRPVVKFESPELASSMLDLYFGEAPTVGDEPKKDLISRFPHLWDQKE